MLLSSAVIGTAIQKLTDKDRKAAIVINDSFYGRTRSKKVELLSNVFDHASKGKKFKCGFRMLTAGWTDGNSFIPLGFSLQSSAKIGINELFCIENGGSKCFFKCASHI